MRTLLRLGRWLAPLAVVAAIGVAYAQTAPAKTETAIFAGGCFWCVEEAFEKVPGVVTAVSGYTGGKTANPTYEQVASKVTGHAEAVQVTFDPGQGELSAARRLVLAATSIRSMPRASSATRAAPTAAPSSIRARTQKKVAEASLEALKGRFKEPIATQIEPASAFYPAEDYHQDYYKTNAFRYQYYKYGCGRAQRLEQIWGKPTPPPGAATQ